MTRGRRQVDVRRRLRNFNLSFHESRLQVDDVLSQSVIFCFHVFVMLVRFSILADLLLQFLDITFLALTECSLQALY